VLIHSLRYPLLTTGQPGPDPRGNRAPAPPVWGEFLELISQLVLGHIVSGKANKDIAEIMNLSVYTVKGHVCSIIQKLAVSDRTQAAVKALKIGLVRH